MKGKKVKCKVDITRGGVVQKWIKGVIEKVYKTYILVDLGHYKECFLLFDQGDTWEVE